ncbi:MAG TPA: hypothetical protein DCG75_05450 [Bacteroidales bacterium]|nr:hypothetical protein [Bacteroidales bacterium]
MFYNSCLTPALIEVFVFLYSLMMKIMEYKKLVIYYFSGTGNARNVSHWIKDIAEKREIESEVIDISKLKTRKNIKLPKDALIGFCSPTHGFNFPPIMFHFLLRFPRSKNNSCFIMNTRAGMKAGKIFLPGLSGMVQYFSAIILKFKGFRIRAMQPVDLPSNWISFHPGLKPTVVDSIYSKRKRETERFAQQLLNGKRSFKGLYTLLIDILITPVAFAYYIVGRFVLAKSFYATRDCTMCKLCIQKCPIQAIKIVDDRPFWTYTCESCMQCMNICPERAIETAHGFVFAAYFLIKFYLLVKIYDLLQINSILEKCFSGWLNNTLRFFINASFIILLFIISYRVFHYFLKFKLFERLVVYTSLTRWKFWRRYKIENRY